VSDDGREGCCVMMRWDVGGWEGGCMMGGLMVDGKGGCVVGGKGGCVMDCGKGIRGRIILTLLFNRLVYGSFGVLRHILILSLFGGI